MPILFSLLAGLTLAAVVPSGNSAGEIRLFPPTGILDFLFGHQETTRGATVRRNVGDLREQLEDGLRPRTPEEFAFIERVVEMTEQNRLPLPVVQSVFNWARRKRPYPFAYFQRGLRIQAARVGVAVQ